MITRSNLDGHGQEYMGMCVDCRLNSSGTCEGKRIVLENNHKQNSYSIYIMIGARCIKEIAKGKGETLELVEFQRWLSKHGYVEDERACKEARESKSNEDLEEAP